MKSKRLKCYEYIRVSLCRKNQVSAILLTRVCVRTIIPQESVHGLLSCFWREKDDRAKEKFEKIYYPGDAWKS